MLDDNSVLQADATVVAGVLILLTIVSLKFPLTAQEKRVQRFLYYWVPAIMIPFVISVILLILIPPFLVGAEIFMVIGFIYLVVAVNSALRLPLRGVSWEQRPSE